MLNSFRKIISICEIGPTDLEKKQEYRSLSELVTILFAVIFGVGLSQLGELESGYDFGIRQVNNFQNIFVKDFIILN